MKRKQYRYYWEGHDGQFNAAAIMAEVGGYGATRFYTNKRKVGELSCINNELWEEWSKASYNKGIVFSITPHQFRQFQKTGKYPVDKNL